MSNYRNFIKDFPNRCGEILKEYKDCSCKNGREVTHMFAIASAAITIPFERLRKKGHPAQDKKKYPQVVSKFDNLCDKNFLSSNLWGKASESWKFGQLKKGEVELGPENWEENAISLEEDVKVKEVLCIIRNALAHGSIFTLSNADDQIEIIIFLSTSKEKDTGDFNLIMVSVEDFNELLVKWIDFLHSLKIPPEVN